MSDVLAGRAATLSKGPEFWSGDPAWEPKKLISGQGARVLGSDGRWYLDWVSGLGAVLLGYPGEKADGNPAYWWAHEVQAQVLDGAGFSLPHVLEEAVAERLVALLSEHVPGWKGQPLGLRWGKTGSDACAMAVRLARAITGRDVVISVGYHGWADMFVATTPPAWGIVADSDGQEAMYTLPFGALDGLQSGDWAAVIIEQPPQPIPLGYWQEVRRLCTEHGALLILDEVVSGLRYGLGGAAERFGIDPDLIAMGKGLGNGIAVSAMVGRREYFDWFSRNDPVFVSSTHFGEAIGLAAANAVLDVWDEECVEHIWHIGVQLMAGLKLAGYKVTGYPPVSLIEHESPSHRAFFIREMAKHGILMNRPQIPNLAHSDEDLLATIETAREVKALMDKTDVVAEMAGKLPMVLFSNR